MVRRKAKWKFGFFFFILLLSTFTKSLPLQKSVPSLPLIVTSDTTFENSFVPGVLKIENANENVNDDQQEIVSNSDSDENSTTSATNIILRNQLRPGQDVRNYNVEITVNGNTFQGVATAEIRLTSDTREDPIKLYVEDLNIRAIYIVRGSGDPEQINDFDVDDDGFVEFEVPPASLLFVTIEYTGPIRNDGTGFFMSNFHDVEYVGMNLYPTHARRVFPCIDDLTEAPQVTFTFRDLGYANMVSNSILDADNPSQFRPLSISPHLWGMVAHNFPTVVLAASGRVILHGRNVNQDQMGSTALTYFYNQLNEWTAQPYDEILGDQQGNMFVFALPDTSVEWHALSTVCIWEPYIYMELDSNAVAHRYKSLVTIGEALAGQWFGFVIYPENWRHQWVITGLQSHAAYNILREFPDNSNLDYETLFVTEVIQESLYRDGYITAKTLLPPDDLFEEAEIREYINSNIKYKAPAFLHMLRNTMGETDYIQQAAQSLLRFWSLLPLSTLDFYDQVENIYMNSESNRLIGEFEDFMPPWVENRGCPIVRVQLGTNNRITVLREHFAFTQAITTSGHEVPLTWTTSIAMDFSNIRPVTVLQEVLALDITLPDEEDFVLFNVKGQGYYRVDYDPALWERILECLWETDCRNTIHPLNRATLVDDALNLARSDKLSYETAFDVVLSMELETEYAPWKAFVRNMNFLRKRLVAYVTEDEDLDPDIYLRMVRRTIGTFEREITFEPDPAEDAMVSLTRGLVMDHACRAGYARCISAAIDMFYDPDSSDPAVNPDIQKDIRPAVYCTMAREGGATAINALRNRLNEERSLYERLVILESLACSQDSVFIREYLIETITGVYGVEERSKIFAAVVESSYENTDAALSFLIDFSALVRDSYGAKNLESLFFIIAENLGNEDMQRRFREWTENQFNNLDDSEEIARIAAAQAAENVVWDNTFLEPVYEWIDENDAPRLVLSSVLLLVTLIITYLQI